MRRPSILLLHERRLARISRLLGLFKLVHQRKQLLRQLLPGRIMLSVLVQRQVPTIWALQTVAHDLNNSLYLRAYYHVRETFHLFHKTHDFILRAHPNPIMHLHTAHQPRKRLHRLLARWFHQPPLPHLQQSVLGLPLRKLVQALHIVELADLPLVRQRLSAPGL